MTVSLKSLRSEQVIAGLEAASSVDVAPIVIDALGVWETRDLRHSDFDGVCDGSADDRHACEIASDWLNAGNYRRLIIPGPTRIGRRTAPYFTASYAREGALTILGGVGRRSKTIEFAPGVGKLLMDNLNGSNQGDQFHGICVRGPLEEVCLVNPWVEWLTHPAARTQGDGIRFYGYPHDTNTGTDGIGTIKGIDILGRAFIKNAPQAGIIFNGCRDIRAQQIVTRRLLADSFHLNACKNWSVDLIDEENDDNEGDDTLALVAYEANVLISNVTDNGSGLIRITTPSGGHPFQTGDSVVIDAVGGATAANGTWIVTKISALIFDLQGSTFSGTYTSGGYACCTARVEWWSPGSSPYFQPSVLGEWHNSRGSVGIVKKRGGRASGVRAAGAYQVRIGLIDLDGRNLVVNALGISAGISDGFTGPHPQGWLPSQEVYVERVRSQADVNGAVAGSQFNAAGIAKYTVHANCLIGSVFSKSSGAGLFAINFYEVSGWRIRDMGEWSTTTAPYGSRAGKGSVYYDLTLGKYQAADGTTNTYADL